MKINRQDLRQTVHIPTRLTKILRDMGGRNPYGEPIYRLCLAEDRVRQSVGEFHLWAKGLSLDDRSGLGIKEMMQMLRDNRPVEEINEFVAAKRSVKPYQVVVGMVDVPAYNFKGFILEKWKPASTFGSPADWYGFRFDGKACLGNYPYHGEYELCAGPTPYMLTVQQVKEAIREEYHTVAKRPKNSRERLLQHLRQIDEVQEREAKEQARDLLALMREDNLLYKSTSLGAERVRQERARAAGLGDNYGT